MTVPVAVFKMMQERLPTGQPEFDDETPTRTTSVSKSRRCDFEVHSSVGQCPHVTESQKGISDASSRLGSNHPRDYG